MKALVLSARRYEFVAKDTGETIRGLSVQIVEPDMAEDTDKKRGTPPFEVNGDYGLWDSLPPLPAVCEVEYGRKPGLRGKPETFVKSVTSPEPVNFGALTSAPRKSGS